MVEPGPIFDFFENEPNRRRRSRAEGEAVSDEIPEDLMAMAREAVQAQTTPATLTYHIAGLLFAVRIRAQSEERARIAAAVDDDFHWILPMYGEKPGGFSGADVNGMTDDAACSVQEQIVKFIRNVR